MRTIGVVTVARSDYGIYLPLLRKIQAEPQLRLHLMVSGMHLSPEFGMTVESIEADGFEIAERIEMLLSSDTPEGIAKSMGLGTVGFAQAYSRCRPDLLLVLGDRFEMHAAAVAALPFKIPVVHIHGGEITEGAIDDALRHSITKLSHLHFVATEEYLKRVLQMGEEPWRVIISGAISLDNLGCMDLLERDELGAQLGICLDQDPLIVTYHPVTLEYEETEQQVHELLSALGESDLPVIFTKPNADTGGRVITRLVEDFIHNYPESHLVDSLGTLRYFSLMACAAAMVGNSSSGIIEAASFGLPVVNIGTRQQGRTRAPNVIDVTNNRQDIVDGISKAASPLFHASLQGMANPYTTGASASDVVVRRLMEVPLDQRLIIKRFVDVSEALARPV